MNATSQASEAMTRPQFGSAIRSVIRKSAGGHPEFIKAALANLAREIKIDRISRQAAGKFQRLAACRDLKVHLGCGTDRRPGWVNIDLCLSDTRDKPRDAQFINFDLRRGLPLAECSCASIYSSHFFEHMEYRDGLRLMRDCLCALKPGGVFRMALPNFKESFAAYAAGDRAYFSLVEPVPLRAEVQRGHETLADYINYVVYQFGEHKCIYDEDKAIAVLLETGFRSAAAVPFSAEIDVDTPERTRYSFYVEAVK